MLRKIKGQSTLEYAMIIAVVVGALLALQIYMKRGLQGRMREAADDIGKQFEAEQTKIVSTQKKTGKTIETTTKGKTTTAIPLISQEKITTEGSEDVTGWK